MTYRTTEQADRDIVGIYVRGDAMFGTAQVEAYQDGLFSTFDLLADNPHLARERSELSPPVRLHPYGVHMVVYTIRPEGVLIVRVLHGRQDWEALLS